MGNRESQAAFKARMKERGLVQVNEWIPASEREAFRKIAKELRERHEPTGCAKVTSNDEHATIIGLSQKGADIVSVEAWQEEPKASFVHDKIIDEPDIGTDTPLMATSIPFLLPRRGSAKQKMRVLSKFVEQSIKNSEEERRQRAEESARAHAVAATNPFIRQDSYYYGSVSDEEGDQEEGIETCEDQGEETTTDVRR